MRIFGEQVGSVVVSSGALVLLAVCALGCSNGAATPDTICSRMIDTCSCFDETFRSDCLSTIESYHPTQSQLECAQGQSCANLCNTTALLAACYTQPVDDAGPLDGAPLDAGHDASAANDAASANDAATADDAASTSDAAMILDTGTSCAAAATCGTCTAVAGCGWCRNRALCMPGTASGATGGTCPTAQWSGTAATCP